MSAVRPPVEGRTSLPRTERPDAPAYLTRYLERRDGEQRPAQDDAGDDETPLYLRRFRERRQEFRPGRSGSPNRLQIVLFGLWRAPPFGLT